MSPNIRPVRGLKPIDAGPHQRDQQASTFSGTDCESASQTASMMACADAMVHPVTGAGSVALTMDPAGAMTCSARKAPSLNRTSEPMEVNKARKQEEAVL